MDLTKHYRREPLSFLSRVAGAPVRPGDRSRYLFALRHRFKTESGCRRHLDERHDRILDKSIGLLQANSILMAIILYSNVSARAGLVLESAFALLALGSLLLLVNLSIKLRPEDFSSSATERTHKNGLLDVYIRTAIRFSFAQVFAVIALVLCTLSILTR